jgi:hypothetical protein
MPAPRLIRTASHNSPDRVRIAPHQHVDIASHGSGIASTVAIGTVAYPLLEKAGCEKRNA